MAMLTMAMLNTAMLTMAMLLLWPCSLWPCLLMVRHARRVQAALVSEELIRTSILWHEMWHAALEEASRLYFSQDDYAHLLPHLLLGL